MLVDFTVKNWGVFRDESTLSMIGTRERRYKDTLAQPVHFRSLRVLPAASIYGGNASGKTTLLDALAFIRDLVLNGRGVDEDVAPYPFALEKEARELPTTIGVSFMASERIYRFLVEVDRERVVSEMLTILHDRGRSQMVYYRETCSDESEYCFDHEYFADPARIEFVMQGTRRNQLFLTNAASQRVEELMDAYRWFKESLSLVGVGSGVENYAHYYANPDFLSYASRILSALDTGIRMIDGEEVDIDSVPVPKRLINSIPEHDADAVFVGGFPNRDYDFDMYVVESRDGTRRAKHIRSYHESQGGELVPFDLSMEASGTKRLIGLIPMMFDLRGKADSRERVYVVDELDRCFHTMLTKKIVELFLESCSCRTRKQLIFTTHDLFLMDQSLMRRDEMYLTERRWDGSAELIGLNEFEGIRHDKDLIRSYLEGRFGGIPMFSQLEGEYD